LRRRSRAVTNVGTGGLPHLAERRRAARYGAKAATLLILRCWIDPATVPAELSGAQIESVIDGSTKRIAEAANAIALKGCTTFLRA